MFVISFMIFDNKGDKLNNEVGMNKQTEKLVTYLRSKKRQQTILLLVK